MYNFIRKVISFIYQFLLTVYISSKYKNISFNLNQINLAKLKIILLDKNINLKWKNFLNKIKKIKFHKNSGGININDQKFLFFMICYFKPKRILEIGTHLGHSLNVMASALKYSKLKDGTIDTVDIYNVNKKNSFVHFNKLLSPIQLLKNNDIKNKIFFHTCGSDFFFEKKQKKFDFIFVDGNHTVDQTYKDIINSIKFINKNGIIIIHDYYKIQNIFDFIKKIVGPFYSLKLINQKLDGKISIIQILKLGSLIRKKTTLALLK
tara:strand:- start:2785 stop:3576 length:792 start_codon:yes stop_codon:yes gene_type:complete